MIRPQLIIFAKAPLMDRAKTRLAADIGTVHAQRLYRAMTARILRQTSSPKWDSVIAVTPPTWLGRVPLWQSHPQIAQISGSLSPRLAQVLAAKGPIVVIGTDCPQVCAADINAAFQALRFRGAVLGPADDGGFWLIGLNGPADPAIFDNIRWSSEHALVDVAANIDGTVHYLRTLIDVDNARALESLRRQFRF